MRSTVIAGAALIALAAGAPAGAHAASAIRPYAPSSAWNTPISPLAGALPGPAGLRPVSDNGLPLTSDPDRYTVAVYEFDESTPLRTVKLSGYFSTYDAGDAPRVGYGFAPTVTDVPLPADATPSAGSDGHIVIWNPTTGVEYGFWQFGTDASGNPIATNGYRYHTTSGYGGRFADGKAGRGAGTPYLAGLVRSWEVSRGRIDHALAFGYNSPSASFVFPASKSDGGGSAADLPEGARIQLDPTLANADFARWGLRREARVIARALQVYGMYVVDVSGSSKLFIEDRKTAGWESQVTRHLTSDIPWRYFRVITPPPATAAAAAAEKAACSAMQTPPDMLRADARKALRRLARKLRRLPARKLRARPGPRIRMTTGSARVVAVKITRRVGGRTRLLSAGRTTVDCGVAEFRLRPSARRRRELQRGRRVTVKLRLRARESGATVTISRRLRLR